MDGTLAPKWLAALFWCGSKWGPKIKGVFLNTYKGETKSVAHGYTVGWIDCRLFEKDNTIDEIWALLGPVVEATVAAGS